MSTDRIALDLRDFGKRLGQLQLYRSILDLSQQESGHQLLVGLVERALSQESLFVASFIYEDLRVICNGAISDDESLQETDG